LSRDGAGGAFHPALCRPIAVAGAFTREPFFVRMCGDLASWVLGTSRAGSIRRSGYFDIACTIGGCTWL
jgi:hypothetical protein